MKIFASHSCLLVLLQLSVARGFHTPAPQSSQLGRRLVSTTKHLAIKQDSNNDDDDDTDHDSPHNHASSSYSYSRRHILASVVAAATTAAVVTQETIEPANAILVQFPCDNNNNNNPLMNQYHFMRAGQSLLEADNMWGTNPLFLTNRENALSELGTEQVLEACQQMKQRDLKISQVKYPLAANAMDTAGIVKQELLIGGNMVVPEYTYMDQRGIGQWDMFPLDTTQDAIWALDAMEAGKDGRSGLPPANTDGTPNETLYNQVTRLRQLISLSETYNSGDTILLIFPDGTGPALLSCLIAGIPLNRVHELHFAPGEVRMDMNYDSIRALLPNTEPTPAYLEAIERGKMELERLRTVDGVVSERDAEYAAQVQEQEVAKAKWAMDESNRKEAIREERQKRNDAAAAKRKAVSAEKNKNANMENQRTYGESRNEVSSSSGSDVGGGAKNKQLNGANPLLFSVATLGLLSTFKPAYDITEDLSGKKKETFSESAKKVDDTTAVDGTATSTPVLAETGGDQSPASPAASGSSFSELNAMEELVTEAPFDIPEFGSQSTTTSTTTTENSGLYGSSMPPPIRTEEQLALDALEAMEEYMSRDDGAEDFDYMMAQIISDDEDY